MLVANWHSVVRGIGGVLTKDERGKKISRATLCWHWAFLMELRLSPGSLETRTFWSQNRLDFPNRSVSDSTNGRGGQWRRVVLTIAFLHRLKKSLSHRRVETKLPWTVVSAVVRFKSRVDQRIQPQLPPTRTLFNAKRHQFNSVPSQVSTVDSMGSFYGSAWSLRNLVSGSALSSPSNIRRPVGTAPLRLTSSFNSVSPTFERSHRGSGHTLHHGRHNQISPNGRRLHGDDRRTSESTRASSISLDSFGRKIDRLLQYRKHLVFWRLIAICLLCLAVFSLIFLLFKLNG